MIMKTEKGESSKFAQHLFTLAGASVAFLPPLVIIISKRLNLDTCQKNKLTMLR